jgi:hypothetical protein
MSHISETLETLEYNDDNTIVVKILNSNTNFSYDLSNENDSCQNKLTRVMKHLNTKYSKINHKTYQYRSYRLDIVNNNKKLYLDNTIRSFIDDDNNLLVHVKKISECNVKEFPSLKKYHNIVLIRERLINHDGVQIKFIEERIEENNKKNVRFNDNADNKAKYKTNNKTNNNTNNSNNTNNNKDGKTIDNTINYIELQFINSDKNINKLVSEIISVLHQ